MANDKMQAVFQEENIKQVMMKLLSGVGIEISAEDAYMVVVEFPDNEESYINDIQINWIETSIWIWLSGLPIEHKIEEGIEELYRQGKKIQSADLCKLIEGLLPVSSENIVFCNKQIKRGKRSGSAKQYMLNIIIGLAEPIAEYRDLMDYIAENIKNKLTKADDFLHMSERKGEREYLFDILQKKWILLGSFVEYYMQKEGLPNPEVLTKLSAAHYEGSESEARVYFTDYTIDTVEEFSDDGREDREITDKNLRMIRKLMEISKRDTIHLYAEKYDGEKLHTISRLVRYRDKMEEDVYVKFSGFMHWGLFIGKKEVFSYCQGEYSLNVSGRDRGYIDEIEKIKGFGQARRLMIKKLVEILQKQKHGAVAIVFDKATDIEEEVDRLCRMKRGTEIGSNICYRKRKGWDEEQILSVTGIDGALFIDYEGRCRALGVIVDGEVVIEGDVGRGARYNSVNNYMKLHPGCVGIVVSEDGMIKVIQFSGKST